MSLTFGTIIADKSLIIIGLKSLLLGIFLSILFGFIFGLILGTTEMPWGYNDWPTDEMKGRYVFTSNKNTCTSSLISPLNNIPINIIAFSAEVIIDHFGWVCYGPCLRAQV